jgi:hypothetical protein
MAYFVSRKRVNILRREVMKWSKQWKLPTKCTLSFISLFYANSLVHVSALLGHPQGDSQVVHCIAAVGGCLIVAGYLSLTSTSQERARAPAHTHTHTHTHMLQVWTTKITS